jgi:hypothetical protein
LKPDEASTGGRGSWDKWLLSRVKTHLSNRSEKKHSPMTEK